MCLYRKQLYEVVEEWRILISTVFTPHKMKHEGQFLDLVARVVPCLSTQNTILKFKLQVHFSHLYLNYTITNQRQWNSHAKKDCFCYSKLTSIDINSVTSLPKISAGPFSELVKGSCILRLTLTLSQNNFDKD